MIKHTATPWIIGEDGDIFDFDSCTCIVRVCDAPEKKLHAVANAEFICRACNAHEKLVDALRAAIWVVKEHEIDKMDCCSKSVQLIKEALELAEGGDNDSL